MTRRLTAWIEGEAGGFVALCPELDIASQGETVEAARDNFKKALELFFEAAPPEEADRCLASAVSVTQAESMVVRVR